MADVLFVAIVMAFFALASLFVVACDRIIGPDELPEPLDPTADRSDRSDDEVTV